MFVTASGVSLGEAKVLATSCHGGVKGLAKIFVRLVLREVELVEASMAGRQTILAAVIAMNVELGESVHALELLEAVERHFTSTGDN